MRSTIRILGAIPVILAPVLGFLLSAPPAAAQADLAVSGGGAAIARPGDTAHYTFTVANRGPDAAPAVTFYVRPEFAFDQEYRCDSGQVVWPAEDGLPTLGIEVPAGAQGPCGTGVTDPAPWTFAPSQGSCQVTQEWCDCVSALWPALHVRCDLGEIPPNQQATIAVSFPLVMDPPPEPALTFHQPAEQGTWELMSTDHTRGFRTANFGGSLYFDEPVTGDLKLALAAGGSSPPSFGCSQIWDGDYTGKIALIERGDCEFGSKVVNAEVQGVVGAIIFNDSPFDDPYHGGYTWMALRIGVDPSIPAVFIPQEAGQALLAALTAGSVNLTMGPTYPDPWSFEVTAFTADDGSDPDPANNTVSTSVEVNANLATPVAASSFTPPAPLMGEAVQLTDSSTGVPVSWSWTFGDGGSSSERNPVHAYLAAGLYTITLTVTNPLGSDQVSHEVTVVEPPLTDLYVVAAAARSAGSAGSFWVTDLEITSSGQGPLAYRLVWLPRDTDNSTPVGTEVLLLDAGTCAYQVDVLDQVFGLDSGYGALLVETSSSAAVVMSRTYNQTGQGTFGQAVPGIHPTRLIPANRPARILFMTEDDDYRSNLGLVNATAATLVAKAALHDNTGALLDTRTVELPPWGNTQLNHLLAAFAPAKGYVDVWTETPGGILAAYGSVVDNQTSDPTTVLPE